MAAGTSSPTSTPPPLTVFVPSPAFLHGKEDHTEYDLSKPNEPYFVRLDHIVELAAKHNILIFIDPIETAGWLQTLRNNGLKAATAYGEYLGNRYKKYPNVAWLNGNDFHGWQKESDDALVRAVAKGIKSVDPDHIQTVEFDPPFGSSLDDPSWSAIIAINGAYVYGPTYIQVLHNYNQTPVMPVFLMEAHYELEDVGHTPDFGTPLVLRREEYWAMLSGGKGQFYGNKYTWSFKDGWQNNIDTPGATQVTIWKDFFSVFAVAGSCPGPGPFGSDCGVWNPRRHGNPGQQERLRYHLQDAGWWVRGRVYAELTDNYRQHGESQVKRQWQMVRSLQWRLHLDRGHHRLPTKELSNSLRRETITPVTAIGFCYWTLRNRDS